ncbi:MAG: polysaccharide biosynthesis/export family protein [Deltaproteobacteria bacterium]|nr:polysaccharide biosynthesis/export family protein [Deltaproteobacteria bacterium]
MNLMIDNNFSLKKLAFVLLCCLVLSACALGGNVVTVTEVSDSAQAMKALELKKADLAKFEEYKKTVVAKDPGTNTISDLLQKSASMSVSEYLAKYPDAKDAISDYRIGGYDVLSVIVYEEKDLSRENVRVTAEGDITFPLIGRVKVVDLTTTEVERLIAKMLAEKEYLLDAHVSVMVVKYEGRKFSVLGAVFTPGLYPLQARERVLDGISKAGGLASAAAKGSTGARDESQALEGMIIRTINPGKPDEKKIIINFDLQGLLKGRDQNANIFLAENDVLYIPTADYFYIIGEVKTPGSYAFTKKEITIAEAISMAGGFTRIASRNKTRIVRVEKGVEKIFEVKMDAITQSGKMTQAMSIRPNDLIIVPESFF